MDVVEINIILSMFTHRQSYNLIDKLKAVLRVNGGLKLALIRDDKIECDPIYNN